MAAPATPAPETSPAMLHDTKPNPPSPVDHATITPQAQPSGSAPASPSPTDHHPHPAADSLALAASGLALASPSASASSASASSASAAAFAATSVTPDGDAPPAPLDTPASPHPTPPSQPTEAQACQAAPLIISPPAASAGSIIISPPADSPNHANRRLSSSGPKMLLTDWCKATASPLLRLRRTSHLSPVDRASLEQACDDDLVSRDKTKQKEAVKRFLATRIRNDWAFPWPPPDASKSPTSPSTETPSSPAGEKSAAADTADAAPKAATEMKPTDDAQAKSGAEDVDDDNDDTASVYSIMSEDNDNYQPRIEWLSDFSDEDDPLPPSAYRFDSPDAVGSAVKASEASRSDRRRRSIRAEMEWNSGLACFNARRDAWTGAKTARIRTKAPSQATSESRRLSWWRLSGGTSITDGAGSSSPASPTTQVSGDTTAVSSSDGDSKVDPIENASKYPVEVLIPTPPPLLPPANPMRASITPHAYPAIYDKIVIHALTPACPINLGDMAKACVAGWKRDGEWPYRQPSAPQVAAVRQKKPEHGMSNGVRRMSMSILGKRDSKPNSPSSPTDGMNGPKGIRRSLQKVLGLGQGHERQGSNGTVAQ